MTQNRVPLLFRKPASGVFAVLTPVAALLSGGPAPPPAPQPFPAEAAVCASNMPACQLFNGEARLAPDSRFVPLSPIMGHIETSTVFFKAKWRMYYRSFRYRNSSGALKTCAFPTGIAMATSPRGNTWTPHNSGLPLEGLQSSPACVFPSDKGSWAYAPDVEVDGSTLRMAYEARVVTVPELHVNQVNGASSTDGLTWSSRRLIPQNTDTWNSDGSGTPDLVRHNGIWHVVFHGLDKEVAHFSRGLARGGASFDNPFSVVGVVLPPQPWQRYPTPGWYGYGPGLGDIVFEGGWYYQVFEGWTGTPNCLEPELATPKIGFARSTDLVSWVVSAYNPVVEVSATKPSCGHDMPNWQRLPSGELTVVTTADPPSGSPKRWKIVPGAPGPRPKSPVNRLDSNSFLDVGQVLKSPNGAYQLVMQTDGNLVLYAPGQDPLWDSNTDGYVGTIAAMQDDGNVVLIQGGTVRCSFGTQGNGGAILEVQDDGNLVVYAPGHVAEWDAKSGDDCL